MPQLPSDTPTLFKGRHFDRLLIIQAVRWYITYKLSYRDVCEMMAERGVTLVHTTVMRWVQHYAVGASKSCDYLHINSLYSQCCQVLSAFFEKGTDSAISSRRNFKESLQSSKSHDPGAFVYVAKTPRMASAAPGCNA